jgi:hypothetical protein
MFSSLILHLWHIKYIKVKRIYCLLLITFCLLVSSCRQKNKPLTIPSHILLTEKMTQVIADIHIAEAEINLNSPPPLPESQKDSVLRNKIDFERIFAKNKITRVQYDSSLSFYIDHPELLDTIYVQVISELSKRQIEK